MSLLTDISKALLFDPRHEFMRQMLQHDLSQLSSYLNTYAHPVLASVLPTSHPKFNKAFRLLERQPRLIYQVQDEIERYDEPIEYIKDIEGRVIMDWESLMEHTHDMMRAARANRKGNGYQNQELTWVTEAIDHVWAANAVVVTQ